MRVQIFFLFHHNFLPCTHGRKMKWNSTYLHVITQTLTSFCWISSPLKPLERHRCVTRPCCEAFSGPWPANWKGTLSLMTAWEDSSKSAQPWDEIILGNYDVRTFTWVNPLTASILPFPTSPAASTRGRRPPVVSVQGRRYTGQGMCFIPWICIPGLDLTSGCPRFPQ